MTTLTAVPDLVPDVAGRDLAPGRPSVAHIVRPASWVTRAYVTGETVTALCGFRWVPTRDPEGLPVCPRCLRAKAEILRAAA